MKAWKFAIPLVILIIIALAVAPLLEKQPAVEDSMLSPDEAIKAALKSSPIKRTPPTEPETVGDLMAREQAAETAVADPAVTVQLSAIETAETPDEKFIAMIELSETSGNDPRVAQYFLQALISDDADTNMIAVECIRNVGNPAIIPELKTTLLQIKNPITKELVKELIDYLKTTESYAEATGDFPPAH